MKTYTIYLFRHGLTKGNLNAQYIGHTDLPLTTDSISALRSIKARHHYPEVQAVVGCAAICTQKHLTAKAMRNSLHGYALHLKKLCRE